MEKEIKPPPITFQQYCEDQQRRINLRKTNLQAINQDDFFDGGQKKNAQIKIINKFLVKLRNDNKNTEAILTEMDGLNLSKFLQQISNILTNTVTDKQIIFFTELATKMNVSYPDANIFNILSQDIQKSFNAAYQSPDDNRSKIKSILLFTTELFMCGFPFSYKTIVQMLKKTFQSGTKKKSTMNNNETEKKIQSFAQFLTNYVEFFSKKTPKWVKQWVSQGKQLPKYSDCVPLRVRQDLTTGLFQKYVTECQSTLKDALKRIDEYQNILRQNLKLQGEFNKQTQKKYIDLIEKYQLIEKNLQIVAESMNSQIEEELISKFTFPEDIMKQYTNQLDGADIFENQFQKQIYENLKDIDIQESKTASQVQYKAINEKLNQCKNANDADQICKQFLKINNKKTRKMLAKDLLQYRKQYQLVTPYMCRIVATINQHFKDIGELVNEQLLTEYQKLKDSTLNTFIINDKKTRNLIYICQLTKFKVFDPEKTISCLKYLIQDLKGHNIQLLVLGLDSVGRFLYMSPNSANKFTFLLSLLENVMNKKSFPIFVMSKLSNSINLLKPHRIEIPVQQQQKTEIEVTVAKILSKSVIDDLEDMAAQLKSYTKSPEGLKAIKEEILRQIQNYDYLGNYHYAYMLDYMDNEQIIQGVCEKVKIRLISSILKSQRQKCLYWSRFYSQLYKYGLIKRSMLYGTIQELLKLKQCDLQVINAICTLLQTAQFELTCKKIATANQQFLLLVAFKKFINNCLYIPILQQLAIIEIFQNFEPNLITLKNEHIQKFLIQFKEKISSPQISLAKELDKWVEENNLKQRKPKKQENLIDVRQNNRQPLQSQTKEKQFQISIQDMKAFDNEFSSINDAYIKDFSNKIAKPIMVQKQIQKKKEKKIIRNPNFKTITVIARNGNNKFVKRQVTYDQEQKRQ